MEYLSRLVNVLPVDIGIVSSCLGVSANKYSIQSSVYLGMVWLYSHSSQYYLRSGLSILSANNQLLLDIVFELPTQQLVFIKVGEVGLSVVEHVHVHDSGYLVVRLVQLVQVEIRYGRE